MDKGLFFMTLSLACGWLILDDFFGKQYISHLAASLTGAVAGNPIPWNDPAQARQSAADTKQKIQNNTGIKDQKTKNQLKDMVDKFFETGKYSTST